VSEVAHNVKDAELRVAHRKHKASRKLVVKEGIARSTVVARQLINKAKKRTAKLPVVQRVKAARKVKKQVVQHPRKPW
jgi:hypothetical protein